MDVVVGMQVVVATHLLAAMAGPGDPPCSLRDPRLVDKQYVRAEIGCVLRLAPGTVNARLHLAGELVRRLPETLAAVERGEFGLAHARCLAEAVNALPDDAAMLVEKRVLPAAGGQTLRGFRESVARAVISVDPRTAEQQHQNAVEDRRVETRVPDHGMGAPRTPRRMTAARSNAALMRSWRCCWIWTRPASRAGRAGAAGPADGRRPVRDVAAAGHRTATHQADIPSTAPPTSLPTRTTFPSEPGPAIRRGQATMTR